MISKIKNNKLFVQIMKFILVGGTATVIDFGIFFIMHEVFSIDTIISNITSFTISLIYNYIASIVWVFETDKEASKKKQFMIFVILSLIGLAINTGIVYLCTEILKLYSMTGKIVATAIVMIFNFITRKKFLEKNN